MGDKFKMTNLHHSEFLLICVCLFFTYHRVFSANCANNAEFGDNVSDDDDDYDEDSDSGRAFFLDSNSANNDYVFTCCGYIDRWRYFGKGSTGDIYFQVWRDTTATNGLWTRVGENLKTHTDSNKNRYNFDVNSRTDQIFVRSGDVIGMSFPNNVVVGYQNGNQYKRVTASTAGVTTYDWNSVGNSNNRAYAVEARIDEAAKPTFDNLDYTVTITDSSTVSIGDTVYTLVLLDDDLNHNTGESLSVSVTANSDPASLSFDSNALTITTLKALTPGTTFTMDFTVTDSCGETGTGTLTIDVQNTPPVINNLANSTTLSEDADTGVDQFLYLVDVTDADPVTCTITSPAGAPFTVKNDYEIYYTPTAPYLDYDATPQYALSVQCSDGIDTDTELFTVNLIPNDPPTIHNLANFTSIHEDQINEQLLYTLSITDPTNDVITCAVTNPASSPFFTKPVSGTTNYGIYVQYQPSFHYDTQSQYDLTISCSEIRNTVTGSYTVLLIKNEPPVFTNLRNSTSISTLTTGLGQQVFRVIANDIENDQLYYNMTCNPAGCPFEIKASGDVLVNAVLYGTTIPSYDLNIFVYDEHTLVGGEILTVSITDINNAPSLSSFPIQVVNENSPLGASVYQVTYSDPDAGDTHSFIASYSPSQGSSLFKVDVNTGLVSLSPTNVLNYEILTDKTYNISISVFDGFTSTTETLSITVANVNEAPEFHQSYFSANGDEGLANSPLSDPQIKATDPDVGAVLYYTMDCGDYQGSFSMNTQNGSVYFGPEYDLDSGAYPASVLCNISVSDGSLTDHAKLLITINEVNDNLPQFERPTYSFYVSAGDGIGTSIGNIGATDADAGVYGTLTISLNQTSLLCSCFDVSDTGDIYVKESLSSYINGAELTILAMATDGGGRYDTAPVIISVIPVTTTPSTTTTDRYKTFLEEPRNTVWLVLVGASFLVLLCLWGYFAHTYKWCDPLFRECADRLRKPIRKPKRLQPETPPLTPREIEPLPNVGEMSWEPWKTEDFMTSNYN